MNIVFSKKKNQNIIIILILILMFVPKKYIYIDVHGILPQNSELGLNHKNHNTIQIV